MRDIEHPEVTHVNRTGYTRDQRQALQRKTLAENRYMEDIYGEEIRIGDNYFEDEYGQIVHENSLATYAIEHCKLIKNTR